MRTISLTNHKGGVAKTTTTYALGVGLEKKGYKILLVDMDPQSNLSFAANVNLLKLEHTLFDVFKGEAAAKDALIKLSDNMDLLVGSIDLAAADRTFTQLGREKMLSKALKSLKKEYDFVLIDTPPSLGVMNENALTCSDMVIVPIQAEAYALQGASQLKGFIDDIKENTNPNLEIAGILITRVDTRTNLYKVLYPEFEKIAAMMGTKIYKTAIRSTITVGEAALERTSIYEHEPDATATKDYEAFVDEFLSTL